MESIKNTDAVDIVSKDINDTAVDNDEYENISNKSDLKPLSLHLSDDDDSSRDDGRIQIKDGTDRGTVKVKVNIDPHPIVDINKNNLSPSQPRHLVKETYLPSPKPAFYRLAAEEEFDFEGDVTESSSVDASVIDTRCATPHIVREHWVLKETEIYPPKNNSTAVALPKSLCYICGESVIEGDDYDCHLNIVHGMLPGQDSGSVMLDEVQRQPEDGNVSAVCINECKTKLVSSENQSRNYVEKVPNQSFTVVAATGPRLNCYFCELGKSRMSRSVPAEAFHLQLEMTGSLAKGTPTEKDVANLASYLRVGDIIARKVLKHLGVSRQTLDHRNRLSFIRKMCWDNMDSLRGLCDSFEHVWETISKVKNKDIYETSQDILGHAYRWKFLFKDDPYYKEFLKEIYAHIHQRPSRGYTFTRHTIVDLTKESNIPVPVSIRQETGTFTDEIDHGSRSERKRVKSYKEVDDVDPRETANQIIAEALGEDSDQDPDYNPKGDKEDDEDIERPVNRNKVRNFTRQAEAESGSRSAVRKAKRVERFPFSTQHQHASKQQVSTNIPAIPGKHQSSSPYPLDLLKHPPSRTPFCAPEDNTSISMGPAPKNSLKSIGEALLSLGNNEGPKTKVHLQLTPMQIEGLRMLGISEWSE